MDWSQLPGGCSSLQNQTSNIKQQDQPNTQESEASVSLYCVGYPLDVAGNPGVNPGNGGITRSRAEADQTDLVPVTVLQPADQGTSTVAITGSVAVTSSTLHLLLDSEAGTLQVNLLTLGVLHQWQRGLPQSPGLTEGVPRLALSLSHHPPPSQHAVQTCWEAAGVTEVAQLGEAGRGHGVAQGGRAVQSQQGDIIGSVWSVVLRVQELRSDLYLLFPSLLCLSL